MHCTITAEAELEFSRAVRLFTDRRIDDAQRCFHQAESLGYDPDACASYRWQCAMLLGRFEQAWRESDLIAARHSPPHALWDGAPFENNRVIIRCLHGYGDAIQFIRYAPLLRRTATRVIVETHPEMVALLARVPGVDSVVTWSGQPPLPRHAWDLQIEVTELPFAFRTTLDSIPAQVPYISLAPAALERSRLHLPACTGLRVGLVWASSMWNPARCIPLVELLPVLACPGCTFFNFQRGPDRAQIDALPRGGEALHDTAPHSPEIVDTAADLMHMDLLITVDTMVCHLAGALGKPVWTLLPYEADWRWMLDRGDTPWYHTMRLFRQPAPGHWAPVVNRLARELALQAAAGPLS